MCWSTDATNLKTDVSNRGGDEGADEQNSILGLTNDRQTIDVCHLGRSTCERRRVGGDSERSAEEVSMGRKCLTTRECYDCRPPPTSTGDPTAGRRRRGAEDDSVCRPALDDSPPCHGGRRNDHHARACSPCFNRGRCRNHNISWKAML